MLAYAYIGNALLELRDSARGLEPELTAALEYITDIALMDEAEFWLQETELR